MRANTATIIATVSLHDVTSQWDKSPVIMRGLTTTSIRLCLLDSIAIRNIFLLGRPVNLMAFDQRLYGKVMFTGFTKEYGNKNVQAYFQSHFQSQGGVRIEGYGWLNRGQVEIVGNEIYPNGCEFLPTDPSRERLSDKKFATPESVSKRVADRRRQTFTIRDSRRLTTRDNGRLDPC